MSFEAGKRRVLTGANFSVRQGEFVAITGPNGSGKTILASLIMGIKQPAAGRIWFEDRDITALGVAERAEQGIALAFQQPVRFKGLSVQDLLRLSAGKRLSAEAAGDYLAQVGLDPADYLERELDAKLSGGEAKRIELAITLARHAKLLIFDEPEAGIDLWAFANLVAVFRRLRQSQTKSIIAISHQGRILRLADKILVLKNGKLTETNFENLHSEGGEQ